MTPDDYFGLFDLKLTDKSEIYCEGCEAWVPLEYWEEAEPYCEDCGSHFGIAHDGDGAGCHWVYDQVWDQDKIKVREPDAKD